MSQETEEQTDYLRNTVSPHAGCSGCLRGQRQATIPGAWPERNKKPALAEQVDQGLGARRGPVRFPQPVPVYWARTQATRVLTSSSVKVGWGGIGIWPQVPTPPAFTLAASISAASA